MSLKQLSTSKSSLKIFLLFLCTTFTHNFLFATNAAPDLRGAGLGFTENKGQVVDHQGNLRPDILFTGDGGGTSLFIRNTGISYVLSKSDQMPEEAFQDPKLLDNLNYYTHRIDMDFVGCNPNSSVIKMDEVEGYKNFYLAHCNDGITHIKSYNSLLQKNIYNNIDILYKGSKAEGLKYDFIVNPGGNPGNIVLRYSGQEQLTVEDGNIMIGTSLGQLTEFMPKVYQEIDGKIRNIKARYELTKENNIIIKLDNYNENFSLIIDPWVTYFGGSQMEFGYSITADGAGDIAFVGWVQSSNFPVLGAFQSALSGSYDSFVSKMTANGTLVWSTYYGGTGTEYAYGVHADPVSNEIYFCGYTSSNNFPMGAAAGQTSFLNTYPGVNCATLVKFAPGGTRLWSTFYGNDPGYTVGYDVTTDAGGNPILVGYTSAISNIATAGTFQPNLSGGSSNDIYVVKFTPTGNRTWASYLGGTSSESYGSISCDASNNIYVSGITNSSDFPVTADAHQAVKAGTMADAFLFKFNSLGGRVWGTYFGGSQYEYAYDVKVDNVGDVYIGGGTTSTSAISTAGSYQPAKSAGTSMDGYLAKFNSAGVLQWATYMGGNAGLAADYITGLAVDVNNNIIVGGDTYSTNFPVSSCAYQSSFLGTEDQFIATFAPNGNIICSGYLGVGNSSSPNNETLMGGGCIAVSGGFIYLVAFTQCNYPVTTGCYQPVCGGNFDAAIAKLCITSCGLTNIIATFDADKTILCDKGDPANFTLQNTSCSMANTTYLWTFTGGSPATSTQQNPGNVIYNTPGVFPVKVVIETPCGKDSITKNAYISVDNSDPVASFTANPQPASMASPTINFVDQSTNGAVQWAWNFGNGGTSNSQNPSYTYSDSGSYTVKLIATNQYGCTDTIEQIIIINGAEFTFYTPNSFTPNGDGVNDVFIPKNVGVDLNGEGYQLFIYDRWGQLVFTTNSPTAGWDGKIKGTTAQIDAYIWKIKVKDIFSEEHEYTGHVNLLR